MPNAVPHEQATGCLIVYNDNSVAVKQIVDITAEQGVRFAVGGLTICSKVLARRVLQAPTWTCCGRQRA